MQRARGNVVGRRILIGLIRFYRAAISPMLSAACRYRPTCSEYAETAVRRYGALRGGWLAAKRLLRCHPFGGRGWDPVPGRPGREEDRPDESEIEDATNARERRSG